MPRLKFLAEKADAYRRCLKHKNAEAMVPIFNQGLELYQTWKKTYTELGSGRERLNKLSKEIARSRDAEQIAEMRALKQELQKIQADERELGEKLRKLELKLPNWLGADVPIGPDESDARALAYAGVPRVWMQHREGFEAEHPEVDYEAVDTEPIHHYELVGKLVDQEIAGEVAQTKFYYELDEVVLLDFALSMYALEFFRGRGWADKTMITPYMMRRAVEEEICYFEAFEDTIFEIEKHQLTLLPSSEHSIVAYYRDRIFDAEDLPLRILAWSPCFRREAGSHGKDTRGLFRVKQFHKVEIHSIVADGEDEAELARIRGDVEDFLTALELPHRTVMVASGDMDKRAIQQIDVETWMPAQGRYRETHSLATVGTWISEKTQMRYRAEGGKKNVLNLYATAVAVQRMICCLVENHTDPETLVLRVPAVLHKYMMGVEEIDLGAARKL